MATDPEAAEATAPAHKTTKEHCREMLQRMLEAVEQDQVQGLVIGYLMTSGGANVVSTVVSPIMMNHIHRLLDERVSREYRRAMQAAAQDANPRAPTGPIPSHSGKVAPEKVPGLPRKVRRQLAAHAKRVNKRQAKRQARSGDPAQG